MNRNTLSEINSRIMHVAARMTLNQANDSPLVQEIFSDMMNGDARQKIERLQSFGFSAMPLPRDQQQGNQAQSTDTSGEQPKGPAAEGICLFIGGQRNHPVCIAVDDRRHRPMGLKPGENAQYDDQGQMTLIRRSGVYLLSCDDDGSGSAPAAVMLADGTSQQQTRMISLRHVVKKAQPRKKMSGASSGGGSSSTGSSSTSSQDYKHEGDTVNTETRLSKNMIDFRTGDNSIGSHTADSAKWTFGGKVHEVTSSDQHSVSSKQVSINGSQTVSINGNQGISLQGPTTVNGSPVATSMMLDARDQMIAALEARLAALEARLA